MASVSTVLPLPLSVVLPVTYIAAVPVLPLPARVNTPLLSNWPVTLILRPPASVSAPALLTRSMLRLFDCRASEALLVSTSSPSVPLKLVFSAPYWRVTSSREFARKFTLPTTLPPSSTRVAGRMAPVAW